MTEIATTAQDPEERLDLVVRSVQFPVVGIGASAGGMSALLSFFEKLPADSGMAFVVILHLSPKHESHAAEIIQRVTSIPVSQVTGRVRIEANRIYVVPPTHDLSMNDGHLELLEQERLGGRHMSIDLFFRTLGQVQKERAVGIVLSGTGTDGAVGLTRVKEQGGVALVQSPDEAEHEGMPTAAIETGVADIVLPAGEMPARLIEMWGNAQQIKLPSGAGKVVPVQSEENMDAERRAEDALGEIMTQLRSRTHHDFRHYKRSTVLRRIERRLQVTSLPDLPHYRDYLKQHPEETQPLLQDMLISVTNFFRDRDAFDALEREALPSVVAERAANEPVRAWVAGCATGEEAYSISILLHQLATLQSSPPAIQIFATDIDERAIAIARTGVYPDAIRTDISPERLRQFFAADNDHFRVIKAVRDPVLFALHNLLRDPPFSRVDLICCRNVLIYLDREAQARILELFRFALRPGGYLFLGNTESVETGDNAFCIVDKKHRIYRMNASAGESRLVRDSFITMSPSFVPRSPPSTKSAKAARYAEMHTQLLGKYSPPSALVDSDDNILHLSDGVGEYLSHSTGPPTHHLPSVIHPDLKAELRTAMFRAKRSGTSVETGPILMHRGQELRNVMISVLPSHDVETDRTLVVLFKETPHLQDLRIDVATDASSAVLMDSLESEIRTLKGSLQDTIEHSETSTEELKASNEELQSMNEELRSATEELETGKEELQSINEELSTVNFELKVKVDEAAKITDDLHNFIVSSEIATLFVDAHLRIKRYTPQATALFNLIETDIGRPLLDITTRLEYDALAKDAMDVFETLRASEREVKDKDGKFYLARILPYRTHENKIEGAVLSFVDVTALRHAENDIRLGEQRLLLAAETTKDFAIIAMDNEGIITAWNDGAELAFGYTAGEAVGKSCAMIFTVEDRASGAFEKELRDARENGRGNDERWHQRKDGSLIYCSGVLAPLIGGDATGYTKIARDVTDRKELDAARERLLQQEKAIRVEAELALRLKTEFLSIMSHELKQPLNLVQVNAELLLRLPETRGIATAARAAETIRRAVQSQTKLIDDLLDLSRMQSGRLTLDRRLASLNEVIVPLVLASKEIAVSKGLDFEFAQEDETLHATVDPTRVEQIVWNVLNNAIKFTNHGGKINVRLGRDGDNALFAVSDTGRGIAREFLPNVFDIFQQENARRNRTEGGMGIGLALVKELADAHGGKVEAESDGPGRGAKFSVWLPLEAPAKADSNAISKGSLSGLRILLVDDSADMVETLVELLGLEGAHVEFALSGTAALELLSLKDFDVLLTDVGMPEMDGYELLAQVRGRSRTIHLPVIAMTGFGNVEAEKEKNKFDDFLLKPVSLTHLTDAIGAVMRGRQSDRRDDRSAS